MSVDFTIQEKIELIINFFNSYGYVAETIHEFPIAHKFVQLGYAEIDSNNTYVKNEKGYEYLHSTIKKISEDMINALRKTGWSMNFSDMLSWFMDNYNLTDIDIAESIKDYIHKNLTTYGYKIYLSKKNNKYILEKL